MDPEYNERLDREIDGELKRLRDLPAPRSLIPGVLARIEARYAPAARQHFWQSWPSEVRAVCFVLLLALFGGICLWCWELWRSGASDLIRAEVTAWFDPLSALWNAVCALASAGVAIVRHLGTGFVVACVTVAFFSYLACVGLGTVLVRFAFARADETNRFL